mmetsp:Transcript_91398/g.261647  ORF Transcript_91398/g.261647 Transcript_91398/m.261647 type:complete len:210 (-) Transcript_91398:1689-2318(-)
MNICKKLWMRGSGNALWLFTIPSTTALHDSSSAAQAASRPPTPPPRVPDWPGESSPSSSRWLLPALSMFESDSCTSKTPALTSRSTPLATQKPMRFRTRASGSSSRRATSCKLSRVDGPAAPAAAAPSPSTAATGAPPPPPPLPLLQEVASPAPAPALLEEALPPEEPMAGASSAKQASTAKCTGDTKTGTSRSWSCTVISTRPWARFQ